MFFPWCGVCTFYSPHRVSVCFCSFSCITLVFMILLLVVVVGLEEYLYMTFDWALVLTRDVSWACVEFFPLFKPLLPEQCLSWHMFLPWSMIDSHLSRLSLTCSAFPQVSSDFISWLLLHIVMFTWQWAQKEAFGHVQAEDAAFLPETAMWLPDVDSPQPWRNQQT